METEPIDKWVRGSVGDTVVVDTRTPLLFWEETFPVPNYAVDRADVRLDLLVPTSTPAPAGFDFFEPHGPVSEVFDLVIGDRRVPRAAWRRDDPALGDRIVLTWRPASIDWREEDEVVAGHPRDPHKRVEALASSRHVVVSVDGEVLAESHAPVLLLETSLPTRFYLPEADLRPGLLVASDTRSHCPYKGVADRYWSLRDRPDLSDIAWSYAEPYPAVQAIAGRIAFYNELIDITVDGVRLDRPTSPFSTREQRPRADDPEGRDPDDDGHRMRHAAT
ncbi:uncharacterized protein (DUF427 family) [Friedmanniella endophytica]|uniref:Uncharacterized protein (DUF427 family) n=1 Tax=Microlunatus kandeliicorticis TaxID=1759536 RepID=A0A7W3ISU1_9ACTN|nr:DUF427 domain-containing protein [Microlunatus kandeliicorticis]MBA8794619.1 uncharacterized protein (DUF427 family) [Microlunatus kandeliicorticis]